MTVSRSSSSKNYEKEKKKEKEWTRERIANKKEMYRPDVVTINKGENTCSLFS